MSRILAYCRERAGYDDIVHLCEEISPRQTPQSIPPRKPGIEERGAVYLLKFGRHYKIGRTNAIGRREYELAIQLPGKTRTVHIIRTDDPTGKEAYWHSRFAAKRANGEWFALDSSDVEAFKRRKFM